MGKSPCFEMELKKGPWTSEEDRKLVGYIEEHGHGSWRTLPLKAGLQRCGKSCRLRWTNYLRPDIKRGKFSLQEEQTIIQLHALLGNRWSAIATHLPGRTDNEIKNYWNTNLKKRLTNMGIDPITHKSKIAIATNLSHMTQWENARLEAEARLAHESRLISDPYQRTKIGSYYLMNESLVQAWQSIILSKNSDFKGSQTPFCTLKFFEKALSSFSNIQNRSTSVKNPIGDIKQSSSTNMTTKDCINEWEFMKEPFNILDISKEETMLEASDILFEDNYTMEALTRPLVANANNGSHDNDFEDNNYWSRILNKLGNTSSLSSIF